VGDAKGNEIRGDQPLAESLLASEGAMFLTNFQPISDHFLTFFRYTGNIGAQWGLKEGRNWPGFW
jgi:hypothetical protein